MVLVRFYVRIMMTHIVFILNTIFVVSFVHFSSKPSPIYGWAWISCEWWSWLWYFNKFCWAVLGSNGFKDLSRHILAVFGYITSVATEQYPEI